MEALKKEIRLYSSYRENIKTIYFGGGTPSLLKPAEIGEIIEEIYRIYNVSGDAEITLEANPTGLDGRRAKQYLSAGVNRLSIGVQSLNNEELQMLGRVHTAEEAEAAIGCVMEHFENFSVDLIYAIPGQSPALLLKSIEKIKDYEVPHISAYELTIDEHTPLGKKVQEGRIKALSDDEKAELFWTVHNALDEYIHYEISNYAIEGFQCRHNLAYWQREDYLGFGPSAHGLIKNRRYENVDDLGEYLRLIKNGNPPLKSSTILNEEEIREEKVFLGLRTIYGVRLSELHVDEETLKTLKNNGLIEMDNQRLYLTPKGMLLSNSVIVKLLN